MSAADLTAGTTASGVEPARAVLARLTDHPGLSLPEVFRRVCEAAAETLRVERVGVWLFAGETKALRCVSLYERSKGRHTKGACLHLAESPGFLRAVSGATVLACPTARTDPRTSDLGEVYLAPHGITSVLDVPLIRDGRLVGVVCHEHVGPLREWDDADRAFALAVAEVLVGRMQAAEGVLRATPAAAALLGTRCIGNGPAHEFRNILNDIVAGVELVARTPDLPPAAADRLARILEAASRGAELVRTVFEGAAPAPASPPPGDDTGEHHPLPPGTDG